MVTFLFSFQSATENFWKDSETYAISDTNPKIVANLQTSTEYFIRIILKTSNNESYENNSIPSVSCHTTCLGKVFIKKVLNLCSLIIVDADISDQDVSITKITNSSVTITIKVSTHFLKLYVDTELLK